MKLIIPFLFSISSVFGQVKIFNHSLNDSSKQILISGVYNKLQIIRTDLSKELKLVFGKDTISRSKEDYFYYYKPVNSLKKDTLFAIGDGNVEDKFLYKIEQSGGTKLFLGNNSDSIISRDFILSNPGIDFRFINPNYKNKALLSVFKFEVELEKKSGKRINCRNNAQWKMEIDWYKCDDLSCLEEDEKADYYLNNTFSKSQLELISKLKKGDKIVFTNIWITCPACMLKRIQPNWTFILKD